MNYREERSHKKKIELKEKELKKKMAAALTDTRAKVSSKEKSSSLVSPSEGTGREVITLPDSDLSAKSPAARPASEEGHASGSKKQKAAEPARPVRASSKPRTEEKPVETPASKGSLPAAPSSADPKVNPRRKLPALPKSLPDMMRGFSRQGARVPAFKDISVNNREDYFRFAEKMLFEFNSSVAHYEEQLLASPSATEIGVLQALISDLEKEVKKHKSLEVSNRAKVEKVAKFNKKLRTVELDLHIAESSLETCQDKLKLAGELYLQATTAETEAKKEFQEIKLRNQLLEAGNGSEMERIGSHLEEHDRLIPNTIRAAEITANRMLVGEIEKGEIANLKEELETLKADEKAARLEAEKVKDLTFDPASYNALLANTPPEFVLDPAPAPLMIEKPTSDPPVVPNQELEAIQPGLSKEVNAFMNPGGDEALVGEATGTPLACSEDPAVDSGLT
ncbi:uncharacterized protein LOC111831518 [Capsella rubella]|uniref:uncharacterized protein LOC111831518 n=1 Tax=Capsella rubella TaxID=81985 RepID=UPI000CD58EA9|nr:uncharacterized protein LOC111831518 [Capsella rubella]